MEHVSITNIIINEREENMTKVVEKIGLCDQRPTHAVITYKDASLNNFLIRF